MKLWSPNSAQRPRTVHQSLPRTHKRAAVSADFSRLIVHIHETNYFVGNPTAMEFALVAAPDPALMLMVLSADGRRVATESTNGVVRLYSFEGFKFTEEATLVSTDSLIRGMAFSPTAGFWLWTDILWRWSYGIRHLGSSWVPWRISLSGVPLG